ncbi:response regulator receiver modulated diguanylate cyclase [Candidatus Vecturithrix granuli]|uniref:Response regulator receiver modulated diguanylate cyclase n=1 Tax=Vecturithrix granuli TaxID=1499967 RepID=A0A081C2I1_VECG1|nr:response regulator receiver modulated diguanylate cyclase [Candidatus Vecturithrix granuli]
MRANTKKKLLVISHVEALRGLLSTLVRSHGAYDVVAVEDGVKGMERALRERPDLILLDIMTPRIGGYQVAKFLQANVHAPLPILMLLTKHAIGQTDNFALHFDVMNLLSRIDVLLHRRIPSVSVNPLLGFPANIDLGRELTTRLSRQAKFAVGYIELHGLQTYNAHYGSTRGDQLILRVRHLLEETLHAWGDQSDVLRHIRGKDFAFLTTSDQVEPLCQQMIAIYECEISASHPDLSHALKLTLAVVTNREREFTDFIEIGEHALDLQRYLQSLPGSHYAIDRRITR